MSALALQSCLAHPQLVDFFQRGSTLAANHRSTISAHQWVVNFGFALRTVKGFVLGVFFLFLFHFSPQQLICLRQRLTTESLRSVQNAFKKFLDF